MEEAGFNEYNTANNNNTANGSSMIWLRKPLPSRKLVAHVALAVGVHCFFWTHNPNDGPYLGFGGVASIRSGESLSSETFFDEVLSIISLICLFCRSIA